MIYKKDMSINPHQIYLRKEEEGQRSHQKEDLDFRADETTEGLQLGQTA